MSTLPERPGALDRDPPDEGEPGAASASYASALRPAAPPQRPELRREHVQALRPAAPPGTLDAGQGALVLDACERADRRRRGEP